MRFKSDYEKECTEKLIHIRDTRARQAAAMQGGMVPQRGLAAGMAGVGQNQVQGAFPQQMNRPIQASSIPGQPQMPMDINDPQHQAALQQQRQQQQQSQAILQQQQQRAQQRPGGGVPLTDDLNTLSTQEHDHVCRLASQMLAKTSPEHMEKIKMNLQNMNPEQRQYLARKNMDPITYFFRSQALNHMKRHKRSRMEVARAQNAGLDPNSAAVMGDPTMNPQQRQAFQNMMNLQRNQAFSMNGQPGIEPPSFMGNIENIQGQQVDGLRSQEAGQLVVPASSSQMNQQPFATPFQVGQIGQNGQANVNGTGISPQVLSQHLSNHGVQQDRAQQQTPQFQPQPQAQTQASARAQAAQKAQMAMSSQAGQANPQIQQPLSHQGSGMPMLNRPMAPGQMSPAQAAGQARPPSRPVGMGQHPAGAQPIPGQPPMQTRPQIPPGLPPAAQEQLAQMSPEQFNAFLVNHQRRAMASNQATARPGAGQQSIPIHQNLSQRDEGQQMANGQIGNNHNMGASIGPQQPIAGVGGAQPQNPMLQGQQPSSQQRQHDLYKLQLLHQQSGGMDMTPEQVKEMDRLNFPPSILSNNTNMNTPAAKNIKTWGQLKQFANSNPQALGGMDIPRLMTLQKLHLAQLLLQGKEIGRNVDQGGQSHGMPMHSQGQPQPFLNMQPGQQPLPMGMPQMRPITANEIQIARQRLGAQAQNLADEQIRDLLNRQRQKQLMQVAQSRAAHAFANQGVGQNQPAPQSQQPPASVPQSTSPAKQHAQSQPQTAQQGPQEQPTKGQAAGKGVKAPGKQPPKRKPNNDEVGEAANTSVQKTTQAPDSQNVPTSGPPRPSMPFSREQLAAMTPQQRAQLEAHMRKQHGQPRGPINRASADQAWNNLPEKIRQLYNDIAKNVPAGEPVAIAPEQKAGIVQQLRECTDMLGRMDTLVQWFAKIPGQEKNVRSLLAMVCPRLVSISLSRLIDSMQRVQLMRQFRPGPDWAINDQITIAPEYLTGTINYIKKLFHAMITRVNQQQNQSCPRPNVTQGPSPVQQANQTNMPALNASNLQQLQQQEEALQRARRASGQGGGAAAMPQPPFGAPSPQGVPHAYGPGSFPPEKLKLPPPKKRKQSHPDAATPGQAKSQVTKQSAAEAKLNAAQATGPFKCGVPECQHHHHGFATQPALDKHVEESHQVEESIDDPLEFALESIRDSLVTEDEKTGAQEPKKAAGISLEIPQAPNKQGTAPSPTKEQVKPEGATPATGTTPMGRVPSQAGFKAASPASNQHPTPRTPAGKTPVSSAVKRTASKEGKKEAAKPADQPPPSDDAVMKDPWADSAISLDAIHDTFMDFGDESLHGLSSDPMDEFLNTEMFTKIQTKDTPDSIETGLATQTPRDSDTSKDDDIVRIGGAAEDNWVPVDWFSLPGRFEDGLLVSESWDDMDWETIERKEADMDVDGGSVPIYAM